MNGPGNRKKLQSTDAPQDIEPEEIRPMGNYAVSITWPDGFTQVMQFDMLDVAIPFYLFKVLNKKKALRLFHTIKLTFHLFLTKMRDVSWY